MTEDRDWLENKIDACRHCAYCRYGLGQDKQALEALFHSFAYDLPWAEICCDIAKHFLDRKNWNQAIYWYQRAIECERRDDRGDFVLPDAYGYTPCIQLCVCYNMLGQQARTQAYNERAAIFKPDSPAVTHNRAYFASKAKALSD